MVFDVLSTTFKRYHLEFISKPKTMIFNHQYIIEEHPKKFVRINNTPVKNTNIFKYLRFKYAITGIQFDNKKNDQNLKHDVGDKTN